MEIVVVGAGVFGAWIALLSSRAGHRVTLVERLGPANEQSSSTGESRIIRSAYGSDKIYTVMARRSLHLWTEFLEEQKCPELFRRTGVIWVAKGSEPSLQQARAIFEDLDIAHDWLDTSDIRRRYSQIRVPEDTAALFEPDAGALLAKRCVQSVVETAMRGGARYEVAAIRPPDVGDARLQCVKTTDGKRIPGELFVFAVGSWLPKLFPLLGGIIRPTRQELFFFDVPDGIKDFRPGALPIWVDQTEPCIGYGFPDFGGGVKLGFHRLGPEFDPDSSSRTIEDHAISEAAAYLRNRFPAMHGATLRSARVCHYENTPSGDFLIDRHPGMGNTWFAGGGSGHGFKHAPAIAEYLLSVIESRTAQEPRYSLASKRNVPQTRVI
jgi:glycine/D-amino acid oxidase-like deaminating enzyme